MSGLPRDPAGRKSFGDYMRLPPDDRGILQVLPDLPRRLKAAADRIDSLLKLQTWARERFPDWYTRRGGEANDGPTGKQAMAYLWASYLAWAEAE